MCAFSLYPLHFPYTPCIFPTIPLPCIFTLQAALEVTRDAVALAELLPKRWADFIRNG